MDFNKIKKGMSLYDFYQMRESLKDKNAPFVFCTRSIRLKKDGLYISQETYQLHEIDDFDLHNSRIISISDNGNYLIYSPTKLSLKEYIKSYIMLYLYSNNEESPRFTILKSGIKPSSVLYTRSNKAFYKQAENLIKQLQGINETDIVSVDKVVTIDNEIFIYLD